MSHVWITISYLVTGHVQAANITPQSAIDSIKSVVGSMLLMFWLQKNITENIPY